MNKAQLTELLQDVAQGRKTPEHMAARIHGQQLETKWFYLTTILIIAFTTLMVVSCYQS